MVSAVGALRSSARMVQRQSRRGFRTSAWFNAAQNFTMPAMSPTMTEGNIASWKVKEGDPFSAGDVLLEIETDKAQMDVEAQDDGILFKITQSDGSKGVKVGSRIAVMAETGDDLSSLSVPEEAPNPSPQQSAKKETTSPPEETKPQASPKSDPPKSSSITSPPSSSGNLQKQKYPLYPAVQFALKEHGLSKEDADKIPATGPNGRLLKGDVLSYVGAIDKDYSSQQSTRVTKLGHLDLSNVQLAVPKTKTPAAEQAKAAATPPPEDTEIAVPISLSAVIATQKRVQDTLGINLPLSVFIGRASELANEDLPPSRKAPSADDLFNSVLGLDQVTSRSSRGNYSPLITGMPARPRPSIMASRKNDVLDELIASSRPKSTSVPLPPLVPAEGVAAMLNVFSVNARQGEEKRVQTYLDRMKLVLEGEPGRLVL